ncbi:MAG: hypothetical protein JXX14_19270, partial [Deltaproteobacteria bacterium]|nr:hypothetical protein [Deltaproteobacteria bacterium]
MKKRRHPFVSSSARRRCEGSAEEVEGRCAAGKMGALRAQSGDLRHIDLASGALFGYFGLLKMRQFKYTLPVFIKGHFKTPHVGVMVFFAGVCLGLVFLLCMDAGARMGGGSSFGGGSSGGSSSSGSSFDSSSSSSSSGGDPTVALTVIGVAVPVLMLIVWLVHLR